MKDPPLLSCGHVYTSDNRLSKVLYYVTLRSVYVLRDFNVHSLQCRRWTCNNQKVWKVQKVQIKFCFDEWEKCTAGQSALHSPTQTGGVELQVRFSRHSNTFSASRVSLSQVPTAQRYCTISPIIVLLSPSVVSRLVGSMAGLWHCTTSHQYELCNLSRKQKRNLKKGKAIYQKLLINICSENWTLHSTSSRLRYAIIEI